jgi:O-antigen ligase
VLAAIAAWRRPVAVVAVLIILDPFDFAHRLFGTNVTTTKIVILGSLLGFAVRRVRTNIVRSPPTQRLLLAASLIVVATLATMAPASYVDAVARETLKALEYALLLAIVAIAYDADPNDRAILRAIVISIIATCGAAAVALQSGASSVTTLDGHLITRLAGPLEGPNQLAGYFDVLAPVVLAAAIAQRKFAYYAVFALCLGCDLLTHSRAGVFGIVAGSIVALVRSAPTARAAALRGCIASVIAGASLAAIAIVRPSAFSGAVDYGSGLGTRADLWPAAMAFFAAHPLLGIGAGNFELELARLGLVDIHTHANSLYLQSLAEGGVVLFAATFAAIAIAIVTFGFARTRNPFVIGAAGAAVALAGQQIFDDLTFYPKVGGIYWIVLAIAATALARERTTSDATARGSRVRAIASYATVAIGLAAVLSIRGPKTMSDAQSTARFDIAAGRAIPIGVVATPHERSLLEMDGLYPNVAADTFCCWLAPHARIATTAPADASAIVVALLIPDVSFFARGGQHVTIALGSTRREVAFARPGLQHVSIPLPPHHAAQRLTLEITATRTLVPVREHINADTRALAVVLRGIGFRSQAL